MVFRFEKKELELGDDKFVSHLFKGIRFEEHEAWKFAFAIGELMGCESVGIEVEDEEGIGCAQLDIADILKFRYGVIDEVCNGSEVEDTNTVSENIFDVQE